MYTYSFDLFLECVTAIITELVRKKWKKQTRSLNIERSTDGKVKNVRLHNYHAERESITWPEEGEGTGGGEGGSLGRVHSP